MNNPKHSQLRISCLICFIFIFIHTSYLISYTYAQENAYFLNKIGACNIIVGYDVQIVDDYAYITNNDGVIVVDVSNPKKPIKVSEILTDEAPFTVCIHGEYCFVSSGNGLLLISNISNPVDPHIIISPNQGSGIVSDISVVNTYVFISYKNAGYQIYNFSSTNFDLVYTYSDTDGESLAVKENILYFGNPDCGIKIFNISDINTPVYLTTLTSAISVWDMYIHNDLLFVGCHGSGIRIYGLNILASPQILGSITEDDGGEAQGVIADNDFLYVADNYRIEVYNMSNPSFPVEIAEKSIGISAAHDLDIDEDFIYVALGGGLLILELSDTRTIYFPRFLYFAIPITLVVMGGGVFFIVKKRNRKKV